ncbi:developmental pluripotency-associated protein 3-like [Talpa occidentalis]|uniref:developmental pluripotency-associated protein 3 n=1 Tax=Talpa occidentalis TaxID=50954 RepID=UPI00188F4307|nr:developmental pluripotency-associated protein 3 [Talpa occidentalis]XP_037377063.1 developmental pluripotency-associated protein 3-like [Talpa occidentalis]XP_054555133.1 developmental pluripotency-associated protein 3-like [Talpa occidentalis]
MDSSKSLNPTLSPESFQMCTEDSSQEDSATSQPVSEGLIKNLSNLTLNPNITLPSPLPEYPSQQQNQENTLQGTPYKRRGVRTLLSVRKELRERMVKIRYQYLNRFSLLQEEIRRKEMEIEKRIKKFQCSCHYCLYHREFPEEKTTMEKNSDTDSI